MSKLTTLHNRVQQFATKRHHVRVVALVAGLVCGIGVASLWWSVPAVEAPSATPATEEEVDFGRALAGADPVHLSIPTVGIDTKFEGSLGLNDDQSVEVPQSFTEVGWYRYGPTPGEIGPAVVLGHVDSVAGPAVFFRLGQLEVGDAILIDRDDGSTARFIVTELEHVSQNAFPTARVYGDIDHAGLRLITCSGIYDREVRRYSHNLIVYARLADEI